MPDTGHLAKPGILSILKLSNLSLPQDEPVENEIKETAREGLNFLKVSPALGTYIRWQFRTY